jgi:membrane protein
LIAAGIAFYTTLSIFPAIAALIAVFGLIADPTVVQGQLQLLSDVIPKDAYNLLADQVTNLLLVERKTLGWTTLFSIMTTIWSARAGGSALILGLNAIYDIPNRNGLPHLFFFANDDVHFDCDGHRGIACCFCRSYSYGLSTS